MTSSMMAWMMKRRLRSSRAMNPFGKQHGNIVAEMKDGHRLHDQDNDEDECL